MAVNPVSLAESLRPWREAGLACLLFPADDPLLAAVREERGRPTRSLPSPSLHGSSPARQARPLSVRPDEPHGAARSPSGAPGRSEPAVGGSHSAPSGPPGGPAITPSVAGGASGGATGLAATGGTAAGEATGGASGPATGPAQTRPGRVPSNVTPDIVLSWPPHRQQIWRRCRPAPLLWTYAELGADLSGSDSGPGSAERSALLRRLMSDLAFPKGSSVFWPFHLPDEDSGSQPLQSHPFFQGLRLLSPQVLIFCGPGAVAGSVQALQDLSQPFSQTLYSGMLALLLPDLAGMAAEERMYLQTLAFLRGALSDLAVLRPRKPQ